MSSKVKLCNEVRRLSTDYGIYSEILLSIEEDTCFHVLDVYVKMVLKKVTTF